MENSQVMMTLQDLPPNILCYIASKLDDPTTSLPCLKLTSKTLNAALKDTKLHTITINPPDCMPLHFTQKSVYVVFNAEQRQSKVVTIGHKNQLTPRYTFYNVFFPRGTLPPTILGNMRIDPTNVPVVFLTSTWTVEGPDWVRHGAIISRCYSYMCFLIEHNRGLFSIKMSVSEPSSAIWNCLITSDKGEGIRFTGFVKFCRNVFILDNKEKMCYEVDENCVVRSHRLCPTDFLSFRIAASVHDLFVVGRRLLHRFVVMHFQPDGFHIVHQLDRHIIVLGSFLSFAIPTNCIYGLQLPEVISPGLVCTTLRDRPPAPVWVYKLNSRHARTIRGYVNYNIFY